MCNMNKLALSILLAGGLALPISAQTSKTPTGGTTPMPTTTKPDPKTVTPHPLPSSNPTTKPVTQPKRTDPPVVVIPSNPTPVVPPISAGAAAALRYQQTFETYLNNRAIADAWFSSLGNNGSMFMNPLMNQMNPWSMNTMSNPWQQANPWQMNTWQSNPWQMNPWSMNTMSNPWQMNQNPYQMMTNPWQMNPWQANPMMSNPWQQMNPWQQASPWQMNSTYNPWQLNPVVSNPWQPNPFNPLQTNPFNPGFSNPGVSPFVFPRGF
jgi:hypothetical protein